MEEILENLQALGMAAGSIFDYVQWAVTHAGNGAVSRFGTLTIE